MSSVSRKDILGRIITLQSKRYDGSYADCHDSYKLRITQCNYTDVANAEWTRLIVHEGPDDTFILESLRYRNHYVDAHHSGEIHLTHAPNPPTGSDWARWRLVNISGMDVIALESDRYRGSYLDAHHDGITRVTKGSASDIWAQWSLGIGPGQGIADGYNVVASLDNTLDTPVTKEYKYTVGSSIERGSTITLSASLSYEMSANFSAGPLSLGSTTSLSFSSEWSNSESQTWHESTETTITIEVQPGTKVLVSQLQGRYGPLTIKSSHIKVEQE